MPTAAVSEPSDPVPFDGHGGPMVLIYDGRCGFCVAQSRRLVRLARPGAVVLLDAHAPGALDRFRGAVNMAQAMAAVRLIAPATPPGGRVRVYQGFEAVVRALATRRLLGLLAHVYYLPVVRPLCDAAYRWIARNRYRISRWWPGAAAGKEGAACEGGACRIER